MSFQAVRREATILFAMMGRMRASVRDRVLAGGASEAKAEAEAATILSTAKASGIPGAVLEQLADEVGGLRMFDLSDGADRGAVRRLLVSAYKMHVNAGMSRAEVIDALSDEIGGAEGSDEPDLEPEPEPEPVRTVRTAETAPRPRPAPAPTPEEAGPAAE